MTRSTQRQPLSPRDFATQSREIEAELSLVREVRDLWVRQARGIGKDRTLDFQRQITRLEGDLDGLRRARRTESKRTGGPAAGAHGTVGQPWRG